MMQSEFYVFLSCQTCIDHVKIRLFTHLSVQIILYLYRKEHIIYIAQNIGWRNKLKNWFRMLFIMKNTLYIILYFMMNGGEKAQTDFGKINPLNDFKEICCSYWQ